MKIKDYAEIDNADNTDLFLIQKGDETGEYKKIKAENLAVSNNDSNSDASNNYYRGSVEPVEATNGFIWDETNAQDDLQMRWHKQPRGWFTEVRELTHTDNSSANKRLFYVIDKRFDLLIHGYICLVVNLGEGFVPSGSNQNIRVRSYSVVASSSSNGAGGSNLLDFEVPTLGSYGTAFNKRFTPALVSRYYDNKQLLVTNIQNSNSAANILITMQYFYSYVRRYA